MEFVRDIVDLFLHLDQHLSEIISAYGAWTHLILFLIVFCETGLVVTPFLPGDSLLFAAGTFAALGALDLWLVVILLIAAA
ncbi:MAG TPA: DedA family protein, partial [Gemmatimonadales bacterium]|nr:DedA family protein [Gemmatimonadales bacterium]